MATTVLLVFKYPGFSNTADANRGLITRLYDNENVTMLKLKAESLDWALCHVLAQGDTEFFPEVLEYQAIKHDWEKNGQQDRSEGS